MDPKDNTALPTVSTDALTVSLLIDVWEKRDVATADVNGTYKAEMDNFSVLKLAGEDVT